MNKLCLTLCMSMLTSLAHAEPQFSCKYGSAVMISGRPGKPTVNIKATSQSIGFYIDVNNQRAEYIDFQIGRKMPVGMAGSTSKMLVFTEMAGSDNHFTATIFMEKNPDGTFPSVVSQHSWSEPAEYFRPSVRIGQCEAYQ